MNMQISIIYFRAKKGITQEKLAHLAGLDRSFISMLERGKRVPSIATVQKIAKALDVKAWEILKIVEEGKWE